MLLGGRKSSVAYLQYLFLYHFISNCTVFNRWIQTINGEGRGKVISVNSYGPGGSSALFHSYMGGPRLHSNSAECLFEKAVSVPDDVTGPGIIVTYTP